LEQRVGIYKREGTRSAPPLVDKEFRRVMVSIIGRCEWPGGCKSRHELDPAHIRAKGMGGGRCEDTPVNIMVLCRKHHMIYDHQMGQGPKNQEMMRRHTRKARTKDEWRDIRREWTKRHPGLDAAGRRRRS